MPKHRANEPVGRDTCTTGGRPDDQSWLHECVCMEAGFTGWREQRLPTTKDNRDGISYISLLTPVKRKGKKKAAH